MVDPDSFRFRKPRSRNRCCPIATPVAWRQHGGRGWSRRRLTRLARQCGGWRLCRPGSGGSIRRSSYLECGGSTPLWNFGRSPLTPMRLERQSHGRRFRQNPHRDSAVAEFVRIRTLAHQDLKSHDFSYGLCPRHQGTENKKCQSGVEPPHSKKEPRQQIVASGSLSARGSRATSVPPRERRNYFPNAAIAALLNVPCALPPSPG